MRPLCSPDPWPAHLIEMKMRGECRTNVWKVYRYQVQFPKLAKGDCPFNAIGSQPHIYEMSQYQQVSHRPQLNSMYYVGKDVNTSLGIRKVFEQANTALHTKGACAQ